MMSLVRSILESQDAPNFSFGGQKIRSVNEYHECKSIYSIYVIIEVKKHIGRN
jgi:hypothetical protein